MSHLRVARPSTLLYVALLASSCAALGPGEPGGTGGVSGTIDESAGTFHGVSIGDSVKIVQRRFGHKAPANKLREPVIPANQSIDDFRGPTVFHLGSDWFRYDGVSVFYGANGVDGFMVTSRGSTTSRGVGIGDALAKAKQAYPELRCGEANKNTEYQTYPACSGKLAADRYIWLGGDPISNITFGDAPLGGV